MNQVTISNEWFKINFTCDVLKDTNADLDLMFKESFPEIPMEAILQKVPVMNGKVTTWNQKMDVEMRTPSKIVMNLLVSIISKHMAKA